MGNIQPFDHNSTDEGRESEVEITDLDPPSLNRLTAPLLLRNCWHYLQSPRFRRPRRIIGSTLVSLLVILVVATLSGSELAPLFEQGLRTGFGLLPPATSSVVSEPGVKLPSPFVPVSGQDGIACLVDAQWSPDGQTIAVLGYQHGCPIGGESESGIVNLYNARSGVLASRWRTDEIILSILNAPEPSAGATPINPLVSASESQGDSRLLALTYRSIAWSPDELSLAVSFSTSLQQKSYNGILLIHITSQQGQVFLQPQNPAHPQPIEWDMFDGQPVPLSPLSPALAYQWKANGELAPVAILSDASITHLPHPDPIGNPDGSSAFSIWQPGFSALTNIFGLSVWSTSFSAWSPGGRYFIDGINVLGLIVAPGHPAPDAQTVASLRLQNFRLLPARDLALVKAASTSPVVAWRPDGRILAAYNFYNVSLYDCRTGQKIATLPLQDEQQRIEGTTALLRWSPDGSHLLLSSSLGSVITIWGPDTLPTT